VLQYEYLQDSAGPGTWRGGMGTAYRWSVDADGIISDNFGDGLRPETAPFGIAGGKGPRPNRLRVKRSDGSEEDPDVHKFVMLNKGDIYEIEEAGGGGYGDPFKRPVEKVLNDVVDECVSIEAAERDYGVVIDPVTKAVDEKATARLRNGGR
jgi:N-methylhydantoinase B